MSSVLRSIRADTTVSAEFGEPAFGMFRDPLGLHQALFAKLSPFGLRMVDIKPERGDGSLGDASFAYSLLSLLVSIRVRFERVEVQYSDLSQISRSQLSDVSIGTLEAIQSRPAVPRYRAYALAFGMHGNPVGMNRQDFVGRFSKDGPPLRGGSLGSGTVFYYGAEAEQIAASVTIDLSGLFPEAVFLRFNVVLDATRVAVQDLPTLGEKFLNNATESIGLTIEGGHAV